MANPAPRHALQGLAWVAWRQHRTAHYTTLALAALTASWAVWQHHQLVSDIQDWTAICRRSHECDPPTLDSFQTIQNQARTALRYLPLAVSALLGAPLFAQDIDNGTHRLAWTQSVGRRQWTAAKLATASLITTVSALLLTAPVTWWWYTIWHGRTASGPLGTAWRATTPQSDWSFLPFTGPAGIAHLLLALVTGATVGLLLRRTLPAIAASAALTLGIQSALEWLRPRLLTASVRLSPDMVYPPNLPNGWHLDQGYARANGTLTHTTGCPPSGWNEQLQCERDHGIVGTYSSDLDASQFLPLQWIDTGICLAAAALLTALCLHRVRHVKAR